MIVPGDVSTAGAAEGKTRTGQREGYLVGNTEHRERRADSQVVMTQRKGTIFPF